MSTYLSIIAGFVDFPIVVTENGSSTVVLHPNQDAEAAKKRFSTSDETVRVHQLNLSYPWSEGIYLDHVEVAKELCKEVWWNITDDPNAPDFEGSMVYLKPKTQLSVSRDFDPNFVFASNSAKSRDAEFRYKSYVDFSTSRTEQDFFSHSARTSIFLSVFMNGIQVPRAAFPSFHALNSYTSSLERFVYPRLFVNIKNSGIVDVSASRFDIQSKSAWDEPLKRAFDKHQQENFICPLEKYDLNERLMGLAKCAVFHWLSVDDIKDLYTQGDFPVVVLNGEGSLEIVEWTKFSKDTVFTCPWELRKYLSVEKDGQRFSFSSELEGQWRSDPCIAPSTGDWRTRDPLTSIASELSSAKLDAQFASRGVRFLQSPSGCEFPLLQHVYQRKITEAHTLEGVKFIEHVLNSPENITSSLLQRASEAMKQYDLNTRRGYESKLPRAATFNQPFEEKFAYSSGLWNELHEITQTFIRSVLTHFLAFTRREIVNSQHDRLTTLTSRVTLRFRTTSRDEEDFIFLDYIQEQFDNYWKYIKSVGIFHGDFEHLIPSYDDFVPGTVARKNDRYVLLDLGAALPEKITAPFGEPLT